MMVSTNEPHDFSNMIQLRDVPSHLPTRNGRKISLPTIFRWAKRGVAGVRLQTWAVGGASFTTAEAIREFMDRCTATRGPETGFVESSARTPAKRSRQSAQADERLKASGW